MKRITSNLILFIIILLSAPRSTFAQNVSKVGTTAADFLQIGVGSRAVSMGGAYVAVANDVASLRWNPAGAAAIEGNELMASHSAWVADLDFNFIGAILSFKDFGNVGVSLTMLSVPEMLVRTEEFQNGNGETFDAADLAFGLTYANSVGERFKVGGTLKMIQQRIWHSKSQTIAFDLGTQYQTDFFGDMVIGASITNFGGTLKMQGRDLRTFVDPDPISEGNNEEVPVNFETDAWNLPVNFQFGIAFSPYKSRLHKTLIAIDALHPSSNYESVNVGAEYGYMEQFFVRAGYESLFLEDSESGLNAGVGFNRTLTNGLLAKMSYSYKTLGRLGTIHSLSLEMGF